MPQLGAAPRVAREVHRPSAFQKTLKAPVGCSGVGLHSGCTTALVLNPAPEGAGIVFRRTDLRAAHQDIRASWRNVVDTRMATTVANAEGVSVATIEHLMAALYGCEIDNALIEVSGPEVPVLDGSAAPFMALIEEAGLRMQAAPRWALRVVKPIAVGDARRSLAVFPSERLSVEIEIDFDCPAIGRQVLGLELDEGVFRSELAPARTFGFEEDVARLKSVGLARGGSLDNAVVLRDGRVLNKGGLRYGDEFVRHKMLDCLGDFYLAGVPVIGHVRGVRSGHELNHALITALFGDDEAWCVVPAAEPADAWSGAAARATA